MEKHYGYGFEGGMEKGAGKGRKIEKIAIAKQMQEEKILIESISRIIGLSVEEIEKL